MADTFVTITDLCGREPPQTVPFYTLDDQIKDVLGDLMDENDGPTFYIGEFQYELGDAPACPNCEGGGCTSCCPD